MAKENSTDKDTKDKGGEVKFDSTSTTVADAVKKATFALEENGVSDVITVRGKQNYSASYYIVKLVKKTQKSAKWTDYKKQLKEGILTQKQNDASFIRSVISKELKEANLKVKDPAFQNVFAQYVEGDTSSSSSKEESLSLLVQRKRNHKLQVQKKQKLRLLAQRRTSQKLLILKKTQLLQQNKLDEKPRSQYNKTIEN